LRPISTTLTLPLLTADRSRLPLVRPVRQALDARRVGDVAAVVAAELARPAIRDRIERGSRIAIGVGSRGIDRCVEVVAAVVAELVRLGAEPFVVPAMGSHGGATADGKRALLASLGFTEATVGAAIRIGVETVELGRLDDGTPVFIDALAAAADGIVVVNRIKPHSAFRGPIESGLAKMLAVGLGHGAAAVALHQHALDDFGILIPRIFELVRARSRVLFGVALVENGFGQLAHLEAVAAAAIASREPELLRMAGDLMPRLLFDELDVLVLERIGKDVSGQGADPNVVGRNARGVSAAGGPRIGKIVGLDLTDGARGNALGMGQLDVVTERFIRKADLIATYANVLPTSYLDLAAIPMLARTAADAVAVAVAAVPDRPAAQVRLVYARDTKSLATLFVSEALVSHVEAHDRLELIGEARPLTVGDELVPWPVDPARS
jgi:hypothetical protein